jgi:DNA-directed RNA polymerase specialized sigma24 family protein
VTDLPPRIESLILSTKLIYDHRKELEREMIQSRDDIIESLTELRRWLFAPEISDRTGIPLKTVYNWLNRGA